MSLRPTRPTWVAALLFGCVAACAGAGAQQSLSDESDHVAAAEEPRRPSLDADSRSGAPRPSSDGDEGSKKTAQGLQEASPSPTPEATGGHHAAPSAPDANKLGNSPPDSSIAPAAIRRSELAEVRRRGPAWLLSQVPLEPVISTGRRFLGFRLVAIFDGGPRVTASGVAVNDVVQRVNGQPLRTPDDLMRILESLRRAPVMELQVLRDGSPRRIRLPIVDDDGAGATPSASSVPNLHR